VPGDLFCYVESRDAANNTAWTKDQVGMLAKHVVPGSNLVSIPFLLRDSSVTHTLGSVDYTHSRIYDVWGGREWRQHSPQKTYDYVLDVDLTMGIWVNSTIDGNLLVAGVVPEQTVIQLAPGWNLIGFPSFRDDYQVADFMADTGATRVEGFDAGAPPYYMRVLAPGEPMAAGDAYWVYVPSTVSWTIGN
jgi:hypothetical protein